MREITLKYGSNFTNNKTYKFIKIYTDCNVD